MYQPACISGWTGCATSMSNNMAIVVEIRSSQLSLWWATALWTNSLVYSARQSFRGSFADIEDVFCLIKYQSAHTTLMGNLFCLWNIVLKENGFGMFVQVFYWLLVQLPPYTVHHIVWFPWNAFLQFLAFFWAICHKHELCFHDKKTLSIALHKAASATVLNVCVGVMFEDLWTQCSPQASASQFLRYGHRCQGELSVTGLTVAATTPQVPCWIYLSSVGICNSNCP